MDLMVLVLIKGAPAVSALFPGDGGVIEMHWNTHMSLLNVYVV